MGYASEQDNVGFTIERSLTGTAFAAVDQVAGQGTSNSRHTYTFLDATPPQSVLYYRLRQTDTDGSVIFSSVITVSNLAGTVLEIIPVPAENVIHVDGVPLNALVTIWNMRGQFLYRQPAQSRQVVIDISQLSSGMYYLEAGGQRTRFIKQ